MGCCGHRHYKVTGICCKRSCPCILSPEQMNEHNTRRELGGSQKAYVTWNLGV